METVVAQGAQEATSLLRSGQFEAVVLDELALSHEPDDSEVVVAHLGNAVPIFLNFGIHNRQRVVREVVAALRRRKADEVVATAATQRLLQDRMKDTVTTMLLSCDLLLEVEGLPTRVAEKVKALRSLALDLGTQLGGYAAEGRGAAAG
jgi:hypothetical protein